MLGIDRNLCLHLGFFKHPTARKPFQASSERNSLINYETKIFSIVLTKHEITMLPDHMIGGCYHVTSDF